MKTHAAQFVMLALALTLAAGCGYTVLKEAPPPPRPAAVHYPPANVESKLEPRLLQLLQLAESPDTSAATQAEFDKLLVMCSDDSGRIPIVVELWKSSGYSPVVNELRQLEAEIDYSAKNVPYIFCRVFALDLRDLIEMPPVRRVYRPAKNNSNVG